ncbi:MAG: prepilin peptidase [Candidatus Hydrogenedentota bacterium]
MTDDPLHAFFTVVSFVLGSMVGSFLNVCISRWPNEQSIVVPRSRCPQCETPLRWADNIPLLSWVMLGGRCRYCGQPISMRYPLVEGLTALLFLLIFLRFGFSDATPVYMALAAGLVLVTFVDLADWTIPNEVTMPGIPIGIVCSMWVMFYPEFFDGGHSGMRIEYIYENVFHGLIGAFGGGLSLYLLDKISLLVLKKPGMGFGDVKLLAMLGAFFGWIGVIIIVVVAATIGAVVGITIIMIERARGNTEAEHYIPFGPYLSLGGLVMMFFGGELFQWWQMVTAPPEPGVMLSTLWQAAAAHWLG